MLNAKKQSIKISNNKNSPYSKIEQSCVKSTENWKRLSKPQRYRTIKRWTQSLLCVLCCVQFIFNAFFQSTFAEGEKKEICLPSHFGILLFSFNSRCEWAFDFSEIYLINISINEFVFKFQQTRLMNLRIMPVWAVLSFFCGIVKIKTSIEIIWIWFYTYFFFGCMKRLSNQQFLWIKKKEIFFFGTKRLFLLRRCQRL